MLINHLLRIINTQNTIRHRFRTKCVRIIHLKIQFFLSFPIPSPPPPPPTGGREKGKEKLDFAARTLSFNKQYLHSSHQIYVEKYYFNNNNMNKKIYLPNWKWKKLIQGLNWMPHPSLTYVWVQVLVRSLNNSS